MKDFEERHGVKIFQAWGMTETSPVATYSRPREGEHDEAYWDDRAKQGRPLPWVELRLIDDEGEEVPWDGESTGEIQVRGPWIAAGYFNDDPDEEKFDRGWLRTGDIAAVDEKAFVQITDRAKDVIKSGGEWISSVELENETDVPPRCRRGRGDRQARRALGRAPAVLRGAREQGAASAEELVEHLRPRVAKWWLPDEFAFIEEIPKTSVGKFDKKVLRGQLADDELGGASRSVEGGPGLALQEQKLPADSVIGRPN